MQIVQVECKVHNDKDSRQWEVLRDFKLGKTCPDENSIVDYSDVEGGLILLLRKQRNQLTGYCSSPDEK